VGQRRLPVDQRAPGYSVRTGAADLDPAAIDLGGHAAPRDGSELLGGGQCNPALGGGSDDRLGQRMLGSVFGASGQPQQLIHGQPHTMPASTPTPFGGPGNYVQCRSGSVWRVRALPGKSRAA
jgi:hypothetical protein